MSPQTSAPCTTPQTPEYQLQGEYVVIINGKQRHLIVSMPGDGNCFFNAISHAFASVWNDSPMGASLKRQVVQYYRSAPQTEISIIEDVTYACTSLRDKANELDNPQQNYQCKVTGALWWSSIPFLSLLE